MKRYAVIDIGSLKVKALIAEFVNDKFKIINKSSTPTWLGDGLKLNEHLILDKHLNETLSAINQILDACEDYNVKEIKVIATESLRKAKNLDYVYTVLSKAVSQKPKILSQEDEAKLLFNAVMANIDYSGDVYVIDMGGGSVQFIFGNKEEIKDMKFLKLGVYYVLQKFVKDQSEGEKPTDKEISDMQKYIQTEIMNSGLNKGNRNTPLIYGSTNVLSLFEFLDFDLTKSGLGGNLNSKVNLNDMTAFLEEIKDMTYIERYNKYPFEYGYMWGIQPAFYTIRFLAKALGTKFIVPSDINIAEGIIRDMISCK